MTVSMELLITGAREIGLNIGEEEQQKFLAYCELIKEWNKVINLVRYHNEEELFRAHFLDSLMCSRVYDLKLPTKVIDLGSGAGLPAVPLKICFPNMDIIMVESQKKRCKFLQRVVQELELKNCVIVWDRLENMAHQEEYRERFDCAVARALAPLRVLLELGLPFLSGSGKLIALKGFAVQDEIATADCALKILGGRVASVLPYSFPGEKGRHVVVVAKNKETPTEFPRRPGVPARKPLGE